MAPVKVAFVINVVFAIYFRNTRSKNIRIDIALAVYIQGLEIPGVYKIAEIVSFPAEFASALFHEWCCNLRPGIAASRTGTTAFE